MDIDISGGTFNFDPNELYDQGGVLINGDVVDNEDGTWSVVPQKAAKLFANYDEYDCALWEAHHTKKVDSPSGTALEIAKIILDNTPSKTKIVTDAFHERPKKEELHVSSTRLGSVPGTHTVYFDCPSDTIELTHTVRNREGLALGAVRAVEWLKAGIDSGETKPGMYSMDNIL